MTEWHPSHMRSIWWLFLALVGMGLVASGAVVHTLRPYYRLLMTGAGIVALVVAVLGAAITAKSGSLDGD